MRILAGDVRPTSGSMTLFGEPYAPSAPSAALKLGVSLVPESRKEQGLILHATVLQNIELAALDTLGSGPFFRAGAARMLAAEYIEKLRIKVSSVHAPVNSLSGGDQQKVVLAKVLATKPRILLLDEPTKGIDVGAKAEILTLMRGLAAQGISVVMVNSVLQELLDSCDRILVMRAGRTVGDLDNVDVSEEDLARLAFADERRAERQRLETILRGFSGAGRRGDRTDGTVLPGATRPRLPNLASRASSSRLTVHSTSAAWLSSMRAPSASLQSLLQSPWRSLCARLHTYLLARYAAPEVQDRWLQPTLRGRTFRRVRDHRTARRHGHPRLDDCCPATGRPLHPRWGEVLDRVSARLLLRHCPRQGRAPRA